jgi:hemerythrin-like domain-containing protein
LAIAEGDGASLPEALAETFAHRYPAHAGVEDEQIYPLAEKLLSADELAELGRRMAARRGAAMPV